MKSISDEIIFSVNFIKIIKVYNYYQMQIMIFFY